MFHFDSVHWWAVDPTLKQSSMNLKRGEPADLTTEQLQALMADYAVLTYQTDGDLILCLDKHQWHFRQR